MITDETWTAIWSLFDLRNIFDPEVKTQRLSSILLLLQMRHVAAYLLAVMGGNPNPTAPEIREILSSVGVEADTKKLSIVIQELKGKDVFELIEQGEKLLADMNIGSGGGMVAVGANDAAADEAPKEEEKKPVVEESESDSDMGMGLFDDLWKPFFKFNTGKKLSGF